MRTLGDVVIANSREAATNAGLVVDAHTVVVHNGLEFGPMPDSGEVGHGVVTVGRINAGKGHEVLVDAIAILRDRGIHVPTVIAGDPFPGAEVYRERLTERIAALGVADRIRLPGFVGDVEALLRQHSIFALPSRQPEGFGLALIEAMGQGLACVATDLGGPREIVRHEVNGLLVPPGDAHALAEAIERLWTDPVLCRQLGSTAARDVRERFSAEAMVERVLEVYQRLLDG
jgi:glycosyltransferase involved in cell wall biosynthesis